MPEVLHRPTDWDQVPIMVPYAQASDVIGIARSTLYRLIETGELQPRRVGGRRFITKTQLMRFVEGGEVA